MSVAESKVFIRRTMSLVVGGQKRSAIPMREIDLKTAPTTLMPVNTFLCYGDTRTGKTTFAGSFPRPLFFSDISEKGYESLRAENWNNELTPRFEDDVLPMVWGIETEADFAECLIKAEPLVKSGRVRTLVIDSISFYSDLIFNFILMRQTKKDTRGAYGDLGIHLRNARIKAHALGIPVVWLALAKHPETDDPIGRPMIPGQQADKFSAGVDFIFYTRIDQPTPNQPPAFQIRTKKYLAYQAGNRLGGRAAMLPDPMHGTYATMMEHLGYDVDAIRASLPKLSSIVQPAKTVAAIKPTPVIVKPTTVSPAVKSAVVQK